jgi:hypothetical protein
MRVMCWCVCVCVCVCVCGCGMPRAGWARQDYQGGTASGPRLAALLLPLTASTPTPGMLLLTCCRHVCVCAAALLMCRFAAPLAFNFMAAIAMPERRGHTRPVSSEQLQLGWVKGGCGCWGQHEQAYACRTSGQPTSHLHLLPPSFLLFAINWWPTSFIPSVCRQLVACRCLLHCIRDCPSVYVRSHPRQFGTRYSSPLPAHTCMCRWVGARCCLLSQHETFQPYLPLVALCSLFSSRTCRMSPPPCFTRSLGS